MSSVASLGVVGQTPLTGIVGLKSLTPYLSLATNGQNIEVNQIQSGFTTIGSGSNVLTGGAVVLASGNANLTIATDDLANTITFTTTGGGGVSSLSGGGSGLTGAVVLAGSGNTTVSQSGQTITVSSTGGGSSVLASATPLSSGSAGDGLRYPSGAWPIFYTSTCGYFNTGLTAPLALAKDTDGLGIYSKNPCIGLFDISTTTPSIAIGSKYVIKLEIGWNWPNVGGTYPPPINTDVFNTAVALWGNSGSDGIQTPTNDWNYQAWGYKTLTGWPTINSSVNQAISAPSGNTDLFYTTAVYDIPFTYAGNDVPNYIWITAYAWSTVPSAFLPPTLPVADSTPECFAWLISGTINPA
jgi:hypothetical protein